MIFTNIELIKRIEASEAHLLAAYSQVQRQLFPDSGTDFIDVAGGVAAVDKASSILSIVAGIGMEGEIPGYEFERLENFYKEHKILPAIRCASTADDSLFEYMSKNNYQYSESDNVMVRLIEDDETVPDLPENIEISEVVPEQVAELSKISCEGFFDSKNYDEKLRNLYVGSNAVAGNSNFLIKYDDQVAGVATMSIVNKMAILKGGTILKEYRGKGLQRYLIQQRLYHALIQGADMAVITTMPGTASNHNAEKCGFITSYPRVNFKKVE